MDPMGFSGEGYFFTFADDATQFTETFTGTKKTKMPKDVPQPLQNQVQTRTPD